jgi:hypothetical protein
LKSKQCGHHGAWQGNDEEHDGNGDDEFEIIKKKYQKNILELALVT